MPLYISWQTYLKLFPFNLWWLLLLLFELSASSDGNGLLTKSGKNVDKSPWCKPRVHSTWHNQALSMKWAPTHFHLHVPALCFVSRPWQGYGFIFFLALKLRYAKIYNIFLPNQSCLVIRHGQNLTPKNRIFKFDAISTFSCFHKLSTYFSFPVYLSWYLVKSSLQSRQAVERSARSLMKGGHRERGGSRRSRASVCGWSPQMSHLGRVPYSSHSTSRFSCPAHLIRHRMGGK